MGYFDNIAENSFRKVGDTLVYYPNGMIGKGRVIPDDSSQRKLFNFHKRLYKLAFFALIPYVWLLGMSREINAATLSPVLVFGVIFIARQRFLIKDLAIHDSRLTIKETVRQGSKSLPDWYYWMLGIFSVCTFILGFLLPLANKKPFSDTLIPFLGLSSFGLLGLAVAVKMYKLKKSKQLD